ncbi:MAG: lytic transglycosylase [Egibacteraceae bacterium]
MTFLPLRQKLTTITVILTLIGVGLAEYTIRPGDTLSTIARQFGITVSSLRAANDLDDADLIVVGDRLIIPSTAARSGGARYVVRSGETVSIIARRFGISVADIVKANDLSDPNQLDAGQRLVLPGDWAPRPASSRDEIRGLLEQSAARYGWNPATVKAVAMVESGWNNAVVSYAGALGIMQVMPETGGFVSKHLVGRPLDLREPADNVEAGVAFLDYLYRLTGGDVELTLGGYFQGLASIEQRGMDEATEHYVDLILNVRKRY